jgi:hypothetical protein
MVELLDYWIHHPEAQGTEEAIVEWWLLEHRIQRGVAEVRFILTELLARGFIVERRQSDGRNCYRLNRQKDEQIRAWFAACGPPKHNQPTQRK